MHYYIYSTGLPDRHKKNNITKMHGPSGQSIIQIAFIIL